MTIDGKSAGHIPVLDHLRGIAALAVCLFHFTNNKAFLPADDPLRFAGSYGWLGVEAFFVISGFVIPYSLARSSYRLRDAGGFFLRRLKRLEPPYLSCILLVIGLQYLSSISPGFRGNAFDISANRLLSHLGYLNAFLGYAWLNPAFWTLAIEFQYYAFVAIAFPLLNHPHFWIRTVAVLITASLGSCDLNKPSILFHWLPLFALGMLTFQLCSGRLRAWQYALLLSAITAICCLTVGLAESIVGAATTLTIAVARHRQPWLIFRPLAMAGAISYSLYLLHIPIGGRVINLLTRLSESTSYRYCVVAAAFAVSIIAACIFWRFIEKPSQQWSRSRPQVT